MRLSNLRYRTVAAIAAVPFTIACGAEPVRDEMAAAPEMADEQSAVRSKVNDSRITALVQGRFFASDVVKADNIAVDSEHGTVTLTGTVRSEEARQEAVQLARSVAGVLTVQDQLTVAAAAAMNAASGGATNAATRGTGGRTTEDSRDPAWITTKIQAQYFVNPGLKPWNIDVTTAPSGVVTLAGPIDNDADRQEAVRIARATEGVTDVRDQFEVDRPVATAGSTSSGARENLGEAAEAVEDSWITAKIQSKYFLDTDVKGRNINVDTNGGVVTLRGSVQSYGERRQAVSMARTTDGVREVRDELRVEQGASSRDQAGRTGAGRAAEAVDEAWITTTLQSEFFKDDEMRASQIDVTAKGGTVTLSGTVRSDDARKAAEQIARETKGVRTVVNKLAVKASSTSQ